MFLFFSFADTFPITVSAPKQLHINDGELLSSVYCVDFRGVSFSCFREQLIFKIFGSLAPGAPRPMVQGPWGPWDPWSKAPGAPGPKLPTARQSYLLSGKATYCQASKDSQASTQPFHRLAPNIRILCTQPFPHTCTQMFYRHAPKIRIHAPKSFRIHAPKSVRIHAFNSAYILK